MTLKPVRREDLQSELEHRLYDALVEVDTYLANDPPIWRFVSAAKAGDVLCEVLGGPVIQAINRSATGVIAGP